jgi:hypothetical protein
MSNNDSTKTVAERRVVYTVSMGNRRELQAYLQPHNGRVLAHLRLMYLRKDGEARPTKLGISVEVVKLHELLTATAMLVAASANVSPRA